MDITAVMENFTAGLDDFMNLTTLAPGKPIPQGEVISGKIIRQLPAYLSALWLDNVYLWLLTAIGLIGNTFSMITILRMPPVSSSSLYVVFLAAMDSSALIIKLVYQQVTKYDVGIGTGGCRALLYLGNTSVMTANWLVVAMTAERLVAIWFPFKVSEISTKAKTCIVYASLLGTFLCINCFYLFMFEETYTKIRFFTCEPISKYAEVVNGALYLVDASFYALIPCAILLILNTMIIVGTWKSMKMQKKLTQNKEQIDEKRKQQNQITVMLVTVSVIFMILTIPNGVFFIHTGNWIPTTNQGWAEKVLVEKIILFLSDCNHAVNFFLYFLSGRRFRQMFLKTFCRACVSRRQQKSAYSTGAASVSGTRATGFTSVTENADDKI